MKHVHTLARGLGWFSLGLGLTELIGGRQLSNFLGVKKHEAGVIRLFGVREILAGVFILAPSKPPASGLWGRVVGDALDIAALGEALESAPRAKHGNVVFALASVAGVTALDVYCAWQLSFRSKLKN